MAEATKPYKKVTRTTPKGIFVWPRLLVPDTKFKAGGEFSLRHKLPTDSEYAQKLRAFIDKTCIDFLAETIANDKRDAGAKKKSPWKLNDSKPYSDELDKETGEETGNTLFSFKAMASGVYKKGPKAGQTWTRTIAMFDAQGRPAPKGKVNPWGGTEGCVEFEVRPYAMSPTTGVGVVLGLESVQIIKLVKGGDMTAVERGYESVEDDGGFSVDEIVEEETAGTTKDTADASPTVAGSTQDDF